MTRRAVGILFVLAFAVPAAYLAAGEKPGAATSGSTGETAAGTASTAPSLVPNHDFENGSGGRPSSWSGSSGIDGFPLDNLTQFWVDRPEGEGRCVMLDTDVYKKEWKKRYAELKEDPDAKPWPKTVTSGKKYDTMAGIDGVRIVSDRIAIKPDATYRITVELRSTNPKVNVFVKGYAKVKGRERQVYKARMACDPDKENPGEWRTYTRTFSPGKSSGTKPKYMRVHIFAYWPPGEVYVDNVLLVEENEIRSPAEKEKGADE